MAKSPADPVVPGVESTVEERVAYIAERMADDDWPSHGPAGKASREDLAKRWGVQPGTIFRYSSEAHRRIALDPEKRAALQSRIALQLKTIHDDAMDHVNRQTGLPDYRAAHNALVDFGRFSGIELEQKVKVSGSVSLEDLDDLRKRLDGGGGDDGPEGGEREG